MTFWQGVVFGSGLAIGGTIVALGIVAISGVALLVASWIDHKRVKDPLI